MSEDFRRRDDVAIAELTVEMRGIRHQMENGFQAVKDRLDRVNGRLDNHGERVGNLERFDERQKGAYQSSQRIISILGGGGIIGWVVILANLALGK